MPLEPQKHNKMSYVGHGVDWSVDDKLKHKSGRIYKIIAFTNVSVDETDKFPHSAVYVNTVNNTEWSRPIKDMVSRFDLIN